MNTGIDRDMWVKIFEDLDARGVDASTPIVIVKSSPDKLRIIQYNNLGCVGFISSEYDEIQFYEGTATRAMRYIGSVGKPPPPPEVDEPEVKEMPAEKSWFQKIFK